MSEVSGAFPEGPPQPDALGDTKKAYQEAWKSGLVTKEVVTGYFTSLWKSREKRAGLAQPLTLPPLTHTTEELTELRKENKMVVMIPDELLTEGPEGMELFTKMFSDLPMTETYVRDEDLINTYAGGGSIEIEMDRLAPHHRRGLNRAEAHDLLRNKGKKGMRLPTYLFGSYVSHDITGHYFDERIDEEIKGPNPTMSRLAGTQLRGEEDIVVTYRDGDYYDQHGIRLEHDRHLGYGLRSEKTKDEPSLEHEQVGEGYEWVDATPITHMLRKQQRNEDLYPVHALVIPGGEEESVRDRRNAIVEETFTHDPKFRYFYETTQDISDPSYYVFCWAKDWYNWSDTTRNTTGENDYRETVSGFLTAVNAKLKEARLPLFPTPLPVEVEMDKKLNIGSEGGVVIPKRV